jgi:titin
MSRRSRALWLAALMGAVLAPGTLWARATRTLAASGTGDGLVTQEGDFNGVKSGALSYLEIGTNGGVRPECDQADEIDWDDDGIIDGDNNNPGSGGNAGNPAIVENDRNNPCIWRNPGTATLATNRGFGTSVAWMEWDVTSIPDSNILVHNIWISYNGSASDSSKPFKIRRLTAQPTSGATSSGTIVSEAKSGTEYEASTYVAVGTNQKFELNAAATTDFTGIATPQNWFAVGFATISANSTSSTNRIKADEDVTASPEPTLAVDYTSATVASTLSGNAASTTRIDWTWNDPNESYGEEETLELRNNADALVQSLSVDAISFNETGLSTNTAYARKIYSANTAGSANSNVPTKYTLSAVPLAPTLASFNISSMTVNNNPASGEPGITNFAIQVDDDGDGTSFNTINYVQTGGTISASAFWTTDAAWGTKWVTGLSVNKRYRFRALSRNGDSIATAAGAEDVNFTLSQVPLAPTVSNPGTTTLDVVVNPANGSEPTTTTFAIQVDDDGDGTAFNDASPQYVQTNGSLGGSAAYQTQAAWATKTVTGLGINKNHYFRALSRNGDNTDSAFGAASAGYYTAAQTPSTPTLGSLSVTSMTVTVNPAGGEPTTTEFSILVDDDGDGTVFNTTNYVTVGGTIGTVAWQTSSAWGVKWVTGLTANKIYRFRTIGRNGNTIQTAPSGVAANYTLSQAPPAPTVSGVAIGTLNVNVNAPGGEPTSTTYAIQTDADGNGSSFDSASYVQGDGSLNVSAVYQTDSVWGNKTVTGLSVNTVYRFRVKSRNGDSTDSAYGAAASTHTAAQVPLAPTLGGIATGQINADVNPANGSEPATTTFAIQVDDDGNGTAFDDASPQYVQSGGALGGSAAFQTNALWGNKTVTGLTPNKVYHFRSLAQNGDGLNTAYGAQAQNYTASQVPSAPTVNNAALTTMDVNVNAAGGEPTSTQYAVEVDDDGDGVSYNTVNYLQSDGTLSAGAIWLTESVWGTKSANGLSINKIYRFRAKSRNGDLLNSAQGTETPLYTLSQVPQTPVIESVGVSSYVVNMVPGASEPSGTTFAIAVDDDGDGSAFNTTKYVQTNGTLGGTAAWQTDSVWASRSVTGLSSNRLHRFKVKSRNGNSVETGFGTETSQYTYAQTPLPLAFTVAVTSAVVTVNLPGGESSSTEYAVAIDDDGDGTPFNTTNWVSYVDGSVVFTAQWATNATWTSKWVVGLSPNASYSLKAIARNGDVVSTAYGAVVSSYTLSQVPQTPLTSNLTVNSVDVDPVPGVGDSGSQMSIQVDDDGDGTGFNTTKYFDAVGNIQGSEIWRTNAVWGVVTAAGLSSNKLYRFRSRSRNNDALPSAFGNAAVIYTAPQVPQTPTVVSITTGSMAVTPLAASGEPIATVYSLQVDDDGDGTSYNTTNKFVQSNGTISTGEVFQSTTAWGTKTVTGLAPNKIYRFRSRAQNSDASVTSNYSASNNKYTLSQVPQTPSLSSIGTTGLSVAVSPAGGEPTITTYSIQVDDDGDGTPFNGTALYVQAGGSFGFSEAFQTSSTWGTLSIINLTPNKLYRFRTRSQNGDSTTNATYSGAAANYTLSQVPQQTSITAIYITSMTVDVAATSGEPSTTVFAVAVDDDGDGTAFNITKYLQTDGTINASAAWQTDSAWGAKTVTGLSANTQYRFKTKSRNGDSTESSFGTENQSYTKAVTPQQPTIDAVGVSSMSVNVLLGVGDSSQTQLAVQVDDDGDGSSFNGTIKYLLLNGTLDVVEDWQTDSAWGATWITSLSPDRVYRFRVKARNGQTVQTSYGTSISSYTGVNVPGAAALTGVGTTAITANWTNTNSGSTQYQAERATDSGFTQNLTQSIWFVGVSTQFGALTPATTYYFRVRARNQDSLASSYTGLGSNMTQPVGFSGSTLTAIYKTSASVTWTDFGNGTGGKYVTQFSTSAGFSPSVSQTALEPAASDNITGLAPNTTYYARITAYNSLDVAAPSNSPTTPAGSPDATDPEVPTTVSFSLVISSEVTVAWTDSNNGPNTRYQLELSTMLATFVPLSSSTIKTGTSHVFTNLLPNTSYYARVRVNGHNGNNSAYVYASNNPAFTDANMPFPTGFTGVGLNQLTFNWNPNGNPGGTQYTARVSDASNMSNIIATSNTINTSATFASGLSTNVTYYCDVTVFGGSNYTTPQSTPTLAEQPASISVTPVHVSSAAVAWGAASNPGGTRYIAEATANGFASAVETYDGTATNYDFVNLTPNATFQFRVQAVSHAGIATAYRTSAATATLAAVPGAPTLSSISTESVTASWSANANPSGTEYMVQRATNTVFTLGYADSGWITAASYPFAGLVPNTTYYLRVKARSQTGTQTAYTANASTMTWSGTPGAPALNGFTTGSMTVDVVPGAGEPAVTEFLIAVDDDGDGVVFNTVKYVQSNGSINTSPVWQTDSVWGVKTVTGLTPNKLYRFRAQSRNVLLVQSSVGAASAANTLSQTPQGPVFAYVAVSSVSVDVVAAGGEPTSTEFAIQTDDDGDGSSYNTQNYVQTNGSIGGAAAWQTDSAWGTKSVTGLSSNVLYRFRAKSRNAGSTESALGASTATYTLAQAPQTPTVDQIAVSSMSVNVVPGAGEAAATEFAIAVDNDGDGATFNTTNYVQTDGTIGASAAWQTDALWGAKWVTGLTTNTLYRFKAKARNADVNETVFGGVVSRTANSQVPDAPVLGPVGISSMTVDVDPAAGDPINTEYAVAVDTDTDGSSFNTLNYVQTDGTVGASAAWQTDSAWGAKWVTGLPVNGVIRFQVKSRDAGLNESAFSSESNLYTYAQSPQAPTVAGISYSSMTVNVVPANGSEPANTVYAVEADDDGDGTTFNTVRYVQGNGTIAGAAVWQTDSVWSAQWVVSLTTNTVYRFRVKARNGDGVETTVGASNSKYTLAGTPAAPTVDSVAVSSVAVNIVPSNGEPSNTEFAVQVDDDGDGTSYNTTKYLQTDGTLSFSQIWQTDAAWGSKWITNLTANKLYRYRVKARNGDATESSPGAEAPRYTLSQTPQTPTVGSVNITSLTVDNAPTSGEPSTSEFAIAVDNDGDVSVFNNTNYVQSDGSIAGSPAWRTEAAWGTQSVPNLSTNTVMRFKAKSRNGDSVESSFSSVVARYTLSAVPSAPLIGNIAISSMTADVQPASGEAAGTEFQVEVDQDGNGTTFDTFRYLHANGTMDLDGSEWSTDSAWGSVAALSLTPNRVYRFRVRARNGELVQTGYSAVVSKYAAPNPPGASALSGIGTAAVQANWTNTNTGTIEYLVEKAEDANFSVNLSSTLWSSVLNNNFTSLTPATTYYFRAKARNPDFFESSYTSLGSTMTWPVGFSGSSLANVYQTSATVSWTDLGNGTGGKYVTQFSTSAGFNPSLSQTVNEPGASDTVTGLAANTTYYVRVTAYNALNVAAASASPTTPTGTPEATNPLAPTGASFSNVQANQLTVDWTDGGNGPNTRYDVVISTMSNFTPPSSSTVVTASLTHVFTGLLPNTSYWARVRVQGHNGGNSSYTQAPGNAYTDGSIPGAVGFSGVTTGQLTFDWNANGNPGGTIYLSRISVNSNMSPVADSSSTINTSATFFTLTPNTTYYADTSVSGGAFTSPMSTATVAAAPTGISASVVYADSATVSWNANGNPAGTQYQAEASSTSFATIAASYSGTTASAGFTGLAPNRAFQFRARAVGHNGAVTSYNTSGSTNTKAASPLSQPTVSGSSTSVTANWLANGNPSGTEYQAERATDSGFTTDLANSGWVTATNATFNGLLPNTTYYLRVKARNTDTVQTGYTDLPASQTAPAPPTSAAHTGVAATQVTANWGANGNPGGTEYYAERATNVGFTAGQGNSGWVTVTNHTFGTLTPNTTYFFRVRARNAGLVESSPPTSLPTQQTLAATPASAAPSAVNISSITAAWGNNGNPGGTEYYAERALDSGFSSGLANSGWITSLSNGFSALSPNTTYYFRAKARNSNLLETGYQNLPSTATLAAVPTSASPTTVGQSSVTANWGANGNPAGTEYYAERATDSGFGSGQANSGWVTATSHLFSSLSFNTTYYFRVKARNAYGLESAYGPLPSKMTLSSPPTTLVLNAIYVSSATLTWNANGNPGATDYVLEASTLPGFGVLKSSTTTTSVTSVDLANLQPNATHYFRVAALNGEGLRSADSNTVSDATLAQVPVSLPFINLQPDSLTATWASGGNPTGTSYRAQLDDDSFFGSPDEQTVTVLTAAFGSLTPNTTYYARVRAESVDGTPTSWVDLSSEMTAVYGFSSAGFDSTGLTSGSVSWTDTPDNPDNGVTYRVDLSTASNFTGTLRQATASEPTQTANVTGLTPNTTYYARVTALNAKGSAAPAGSLNTSPALLATQPDVPAGGSFTSVQSNQVSVSWTSGANPAATTRYSAEISDDGGFSNIVNTQNTVAGTSNATFPGLNANTVYYARVRAVGHAGAFSTYLTIGSTTTTPNLPGSPNTSGATTSALTFGWALNGNAPGTQFEAQRDSDSGMSPVDQTSATVNTSVVFGGLAPNTTYYFDVRTMGTPPSAYTTPVVTGVTLANAPLVGAGISSVGATSANVAWSANGNPGVTLYTAEASIDSFGSVLSAGQTTATNRTLSGLTPNSLHQFRVRAVNHSGVATADFDLGSARTLAASPSLASFTPATTAMTVTWNTNNNPGGTVYVASNTTTAQGSGRITANSWQSAGLSVNAPYDFSVQAVNADDIVTSFVSMGTRYTSASTPLVPINKGQSGSTLSVAVNPGTNPVGTELAIRVEDVTSFPTVNTYYAQTPDGSDESLLAGTTVWLTYGGAGAGWRGTAGITITGGAIIPGRQYQVSVVARNGDSIETAYGPKLTMSTASGQPVIALSGKSSGDWVNTTVVSFTATGSFHYHYKFTKDSSPNAGAGDPGWSGGILSGAPLHDDASQTSPSNTDFVADLSGFRATSEGQWNLTLWGDANTPAGTHTPGLTQVAPFTINVDVTPPTVGAISAKFASNDPTLITSGLNTADDTPYFHWTNNQPTDNTAAGVSRIVGYSYSLSTNPNAVPPSTADGAIDAASPSVFVNTPQTLGVYYFRVRAFDAAGNMTPDGSLSTFMYHYTPESVPPKILIVKIGPNIFLPGTNIFIAVQINITISIPFSEIMNSITLSNGGLKLRAVKDNRGRDIDVDIPLTIVFDMETLVASIKPREDLKKGHMYEVKVTKDAKDLGNNSPEEEQVYRFQTMMDRMEDNVVLSNDGKTRLIFAAGALPQELGIAINSDPLNAPMAAPSISTIIGEANERARAGSGGFAQSIHLEEFNAYDDQGVRRSGLFNGDVTLIMSYSDDNNDGFVDGSNPPVRETALAISWLDEDAGVWVRVPGSSVDTAGNTITANIRHFSVYGIIGAPSTNMTEAYAFPVPFRPSQGDSVLTFTNLPSLANIKVFTIDGKIVRELEETDGDGQLTWDVTNSDGQPLASEVYFYLITSGPEKKTGKFVVIR